MRAGGAVLGYVSTLLSVAGRTAASLKSTLVDDGAAGEIHDGAGHRPGVV